MSNLLADMEDELDPRQSCIFVLPVSRLFNRTHSSR